MAETSSAKVRPRLWPAVVLIALQFACMYLPGLVAPGTLWEFFPRAFAPTLVAVLLLGWWLGFSRVPVRDRFLGVLLVAALSAGVYFVAHPTLSGDPTKDIPPFGLMMYVVPTFTTIVVAGFLMTNLLSWSAQKGIVGAFLFLAAVGWCLVRTDGITADFRGEFAFRFAPKLEDKFLAAQAEEELDQSLAKDIPFQADPADWPGFRGLTRRGVVENVTFGTDWEDNPPKEIWKQPSGPGWGSFAVVGDFAFTQEQRGDVETVVCYHIPSGNEVWVNEVKARFEEVVSGAGPRATPTFADGWLYTTGAKGTVQCLEARSGETVWQRDLTEDTGAKVPMWAFSGSPLVTGDKVIIFAGGQGSGVVAYDRVTGDIAWKGGLGTHSYSSAQLSTLSGVEQVLMSSDIGLQSFDPYTGEVIWEYRWEVPDAYRSLQPLVVGDDSIFMENAGGPGVRKLNVRLESSEWQVSKAWDSTRAFPGFYDMVYHNGHLFVQNREVLVCLDGETGKVAWRERLPAMSQMLLVKDMNMLLMITEEGEVLLVEANPEEFYEVASFQPLEDKVWNHPVVARGKLMVRSRSEIGSYLLPAVE